MSVAASVLVTTAFVAFDVLAPLSIRCRNLLALSYFACGLAFAIAASFGMLLLSPPPNPQPTTNLLEALGKAFALVFSYLFVFGLFTTASFAIAVAHWRQQRAAKWLVLINVPGVLITAHVFVLIPILECCS